MTVATFYHPLQKKLQMPRGTAGPLNDPSDPNNPNQGIANPGSGDWHLHPPPAPPAPPDDGDYVIAFLSTLPEIPTVVATCHVEPGKDKAFASVYDITPHGFKVKLTDHAGSGGSWRFDFVATV